ncbi:hypothetical protein [Curtobacterium sp. BRB10]|uniref:hypothetical protein n=1 Tax=Curtobacterium sp. BRB10 TaxID=2962579 RepID=UPI00288215EB|nr:hypothetical protein [Curtobacterium sp. BRB10]MDT0234725.1 hypothetical protein [Curtobacterium sp. BRB10]
MTARGAGQEARDGPAPGFPSVRAHVARRASAAGTVASGTANRPFLLTKCSSNRFGDA